MFCDNPSVAALASLPSLAWAHGWKYLMAAATAASRFSRAAAADVCKCRVEYEAKPRKDTTKRSTHGLSLK